MTALLTAPFGHGSVHSVTEPRPEGAVNADDFHTVRGNQ